MMDKGGTSVESNNSQAERRKRDPIGQILDLLSNASSNSTEDDKSKESDVKSEIYSSDNQKDKNSNTKIENIPSNYVDKTGQEHRELEEGSAFKPFKNFQEFPNAISNQHKWFIQNNFSGINHFGRHQLYADQSPGTPQATNANLLSYPGFPIQYPNIPDPAAHAMVPTLPFVFPQNYGFYPNYNDSRNVNMLSWLGKSVTTDTSFNPACILNAEKTGSHMTHSPPRYQCESCKKSYSTYGGLSKHKQFHCVNQIKKEFSCKFCGKCYGSLGALKMHIRTHTLPCKCKICGKAFSRPWLLQGHIRTHTGEKPFRCDHCTRAFADRSNLRAHLQTHSEVKKYGCKSCNKTFSRMSLLVKHRENHCYR